MADWLWKLCLTFAGGSLLTLILYRAFIAPLARLPGPWYSLLTDVYLMYKEFTGQRRVYIHDLHKKYGSVVRIGPSEVAFTSLEALKEIYQSGGSGYDKTEFYELFMQYDTRTMFSTLERRGHDQLKRNIAGAYTNTAIMQHEVLEGIQVRVDEFLDQCKDAGDQALDFYDLLHCYAMDCASFQLLHPHGTKSISGRDFHLMQEYSYGDTLKMKMCRYRWPILTRWIEDTFKPKLESKIGQYVVDATRRGDSAKHTVAHKLRTCNANFSSEQVAAECMNHLAAGIDTTGDALCFLIHKLSSPEGLLVQEKLITEITIHDDTAIDELPYLDAVVKEGLRCFPPIPMSQPRMVPVGGRNIDGFLIPGGTIVSCQAWSVHQLNTTIFPDGNEFQPERWVETSSASEMNRLFFSFSAGGRACTGKHLALVEMKYLLRGLYSQYRTLLAPEMAGSMELFDQSISTRPLDQTCLLRIVPII